jgi:hypothetical protein
MAKRASQQKHQHPEFFPPLTFWNAFLGSIGARGCEEIRRHLIHQQVLYLNMSCNVNVVCEHKTHYIFRGNAGVAVRLKSVAHAPWCSITA